MGRGPRGQKPWGKRALCTLDLVANRARGQEADPLPGDLPPWLLGPVESGLATWMVLVRMAHQDYFFSGHCIAVRLDAGIRQAEACRGDPVGIEALPGYGQTSKPKPKKGGS